MRILHLNSETRIDLSDSLVIFGNRNFNLETFAKEFPTISLHRLKQVHGEAIVHALKPPITESSLLHNQETPVADGQWTAQKQLALLISTADCAPVFLFSKNPELVFGLHVGWRGAVQKIISGGMQKIRALGASPAKIYAFIGPHIQKNSFEIQADVLSQLLGSISDSKAQDRSFIVESGNGRFNLDLEYILRAQLTEAGVLDENIWSHSADTKSDLSYHSFRRDREKSGRQLSLIFLKG